MDGVGTGMPESHLDGDVNRTLRFNQIPLRSLHD